jgi:plasmid stability protein
MDPKRMRTLTIKNVPDELYEQLKSAAAENRRSLNSETLHRLERTLRTGSPRIDPDRFLADVRAFRESLGPIWVDDETLDRAKRWGRP